MNPERKAPLARRAGSAGRHPEVLAWDQWASSDDGSPLADPTTLYAPADKRLYLENRLRRAFHAGWMAAERQNVKAD